MKQYTLIVSAVVGAIASLSVFPVTAQSWFSIAQVDGNHAYIDVESLQRTSPNVQWWQKIEFAPGQAAKQALYYVSANCKGSAIKIRQKIVYDQDGIILEQENLGDRGSVIRPTPGSLQYSLVKAACAGEDGLWR
ncbi:MAG TPA: surface-adhesin E family protein [Coleofasciculaceae cyanobacterium]